MDKEQAKKLPGLASLNPLGHLPEFTKDPKNYMTIERALLDTLSCKKTHSDPIAMMDCKTCQNNTLERRALMKKFGFRSPAEYMKWKEMQNEIKKRMPLDMYNRMVDGKPLL